MRRYRPGSAERLVLGRILDKRHRAAAEPEQRRFERTYEQTERRQRALRRSAWIAAGVSLIGAAASLASVWFSWYSQTHRLQPPAETATPPAIAPFADDTRAVMRNAFCRTSSSIILAGSVRWTFRNDSAS